MLRPGACYSVHFLSGLLFVCPVLIVSFKKIFIYLYVVVVAVVYLCAYEYVCVCPPVCHSAHVQARAELTGASSLLSLCGPWGLRQHLYLLSHLVCLLVFSLSYVLSLGILNLPSGLMAAQSLGLCPKPWTESLRF